MDSQALAYLMNSHAPLTADDAAEGPLAWTGGLQVGGELHEVDAEATTADTLVLANGSAIRWSPRGTYCGGTAAGCEHVRNSAVESQAGHWSPADYQEWVDTEDCDGCGHDAEATCGVRRDARTVTVWDGNGFSDTDVYGTADKARAAYARQITELRKMSHELGRHDHADES